MIVGGGGPKRTPALAARFATEYNIGFVAEDVVAEKFAVVRAACESTGRDPGTLKFSVALPTILGADDRTIERRAAAIGQTREQFDNGANLIGSAAQIADKVERLRAIGADRVYFQLLDLRDVEHADEIGTDLLPLLPR